MVPIALSFQETKNRLQSTLMSKRDAWDQKQEPYDNLKDERMQKVNSFRMIFAECNEIIASENQMVADLETLRIETDQVEMQLAMARSSAIDCAHTMSLYGAFKQQNETNIKVIADHFSAQWDSFESVCHKWTTHEMCVWLRKIAFAPDAEDVDQNSLVWLHRASCGMNVSLVYSIG